MRWRARPSRGARCGHRVASSLSGGDSGRRKTGTNADRPGYQLMLRELPKIKPAYVAVWKNDRLARDRAELLLVKQAIRSVGARVHYIEGISPTDSPDSVLMEGA